MTKNKLIIFGVTASIAAYKTCDLIRKAKKNGYEAKCIMSKDASQFITALTLETLSGNKVADSMFGRTEKKSPEHISLSEEADIIVVAPATADIIGKIASGICDDLLTCTICASRKPVLIAPAMNDHMYGNPIIQDKIVYLKEKGYFFIEPVEGDLACGRKGIGHLASIDGIFNKIESILKDK